MNKTDAVRKHLEEKGEIDTWTAISQYKATRLSSIIFNLRKEGMPIQSIKSQHETNFVTYKLNNSPQGELFR